jgi:hypothetical protein
MLIYYCLILWIGMVSLFSINIKDKKKRNRIVIILCCLGVLIIQALRASSVGVDVNGYLKGYQIAKDINIFAGERLFNFEVGYILYSQLISKLGIPNQWYLAIVAFTIIIPIAFTWMKNSKMPAISVFIYITLGFFAFSFSGLRQAIAISIVFYSFKYIQERSLIKFLLCVILAISFHTSAIIFIFAYPLYQLRLKPIQLCFVVITFILTFLLRNIIYLPIYTLYKGVEGHIQNTGAYTMLFVMIGVLVLSYLFGPKYSVGFNAYKNYMIVAIFIQIFASQSTIAMRAGYYYYIFITLLIPEVINAQRDLKVRITAVVVLILALLYFFQVTIGSGSLNVSPYYFYWE